MAKKEKSAIEVALSEARAAAKANRALVKELLVQVKAEREASKATRAQGKVDRAAKRVEKAKALREKLEARIQKDKERLAAIAAKKLSPKAIRRKNRTPSTVTVVDPSSVKVA